MKQFVNIACLLFILFSLQQAQGQPDEEIKLLTNNQSFTAGDKIELSFQVTTDEFPHLFVHGSYGSTVVTPTQKGKTIRYSLPALICKKTGTINWQLLSRQTQLLKGTFKILPKVNAVAEPECYFGPRQIQAGNRDYSMLVVVPTDLLDNPLPEGTPVTIKHQFLQANFSDELEIKNAIAWKNFYTRTTTGTIFVSANCMGKSSKELISEIYPENASDFNIFYSRHHQFADGNEVTTFTTSAIRDTYGNLISDGTLVSFIIQKPDGAKLQVGGLTVNGQAKAQIIHPDHPTSWQIKAYVTGLAESNELNIQYKSILADFKISYSKEKQLLTVGPLTSFMNQLIPDGVRVKLALKNDSVLVDQLAENTKNGYARFLIQKDFYQQANYDITIDALGISKTIHINQNDGLTQ
ncbi:hypothetical protein [uncultured Sunxiuqinia sp.]|uniref:hypothetical protein n=1 Tax=uncultured Sunxiuqinia sp. TaxID=1573825 RepID=UPI002AA8B468|nr:hypothetical protein [uncultured Sunxiuqinia sp.]